MRLIFTFLFLLNSFFLFCQTEKGSMLLNFNGHLTHYHANYLNINEKYFSGIMQMEAGYALLNNLFFGVKYDAFSVIGFPDNNYFSIPNYGIFSRYYFLKNKNRAYLQTDVNHFRGGLDFRQTRWNLGAGFTHFLAKHVAFDIHFNYNLFLWDNSPLSFIVTNDPVFYTVDRQTGLDCSVGLNFFLPSGHQKPPVEKRPPLVERYLKKGNKSIYLSGTFDFKHFYYQGVFEKSKFINDDIRVKHRIFGWGDLGNSPHNSGFKLYTSSFEKYLPLSGRFFFAPILGVGPMVGYSGNFDDLDLGYNLIAQAGFTQFFKNTKAGLGITFNSFDFFEPGLDITFTSNLFLSGEIFITDKLAIHPILYYNLLDEPVLLYFFDNSGLVGVSKFRLQFGFSYYY